MNYRKLETGLAWLSLVGAFIHFILETLYHVMVGQFLPLLLVDYIAVALLVYAAVVSLRIKPSSASGLLSGAWGFAACLAYIAFFVFFEQHIKNGEQFFMVVTLGVALLVALAAFLISLQLVRVTMRKR